MENKSEVVKKNFRNFFCHGSHMFLCLVVMSNQHHSWWHTRSWKYTLICTPKTCWQHSCKLDLLCQSKRGVYLILILIWSSCNLIGFGNIPCWCTPKSLCIMTWHQDHQLCQFRTLISYPSSYLFLMLFCRIWKSPEPMHSKEHRMTQH